MSALILVISSWIVLFFILLGLAILIRRLSGVKTPGIEKLFDYFWIAFGLVVFLLQLWHLFFRIDWRPLLLVGIVGLTSLIFNYKELGFLLYRGFLKGWTVYVILPLMLLCLAFNAIFPPSCYDSGLYHFNSVRWATSFPIVPGLGNLHGRLAFNSAYFLYVAMLEAGPWIHKSHHLANGFLLFAFLLQVYITSLKLFKNSASLRLYQIFNILILPSVVNAGNISSPSPDLPIFILAIVLFSKLLAYIEDPDNSKEAGWTVLLIATLAILGIIIKLNFLVFGIASLFVAIILWRVRNNGSCSYKKMLILLMASIAVGIIPWMIRGVILSGYIVYPITTGSFPVEWRIPYERVVEMQHWLQGWARTPGIDWSKVLGSQEWIKPWATRAFENYDVMMPLLLTSFAAFLFLFFRIKRRSYPAACKYIWLCLLPSVASLIFWFVTAPDLRYGGVFFWLLGAGTLTIAVRYIDNNRLRGILKLYITVFIIYFLFSNIPVDRKMSFVKSTIRERNFIKTSQKLQSGFRSIMKATRVTGCDDIPCVEVKKFTTDSGLVVYVPKGGDQCWDALLPCAPSPDSRLLLRKRGDLRHGFIIDTKNIPVIH